MYGVRSISAEQIGNIPRGGADAFERLERSDDPRGEGNVRTVQAFGYDRPTIEARGVAQEEDHSSRFACHGSSVNGSGPTGYNLSGGFP